MFFSTAFDMADHTILLDHLQECVSVTRFLLEWLDSYFLTALSVKGSNFISSVNANCSVPPGLHFRSYSSWSVFDPTWLKHM